jgi:hypothetical protein
MDWNQRIVEIKKIKEYITANTSVFANDKKLQYYYGSLNRLLLDLNEVEIDMFIEKINMELYD